MLYCNMLSENSNVLFDVTGGQDATTAADQDEKEKRFTDWARISNPFGPKSEKR